ncbi:hypothetical protein JCM33374_g1466 [Metschnikowia sp. JCM 33374]|nr:hypothetical protein JCM33374_g1466 [Metschnikowia sp. JCM 33374]
MSQLKSITSLAVACPGQGIVPRGCLYGVRAYRPLFQQTLDCVDSVLDTNVSDILLQEPPHSSAPPDPWSLSTANAQPAIVAATYALTEILKDVHDIDLTSDRRVSYFLGHSLGEYTALLLAGVLTLPQAVRVVRERGLLMEQVVQDNRYEMRVLVFRPSAYNTVYDVATEHGVLACANNNSQVSISGDPATLDAVIDKLNTPKKTVLKQVKLPVTVPFHSKILQEIEPKLAALVSETRPSSKPIISNYTGGISQGNLFANTVKCNSAPVQWKRSMEFLESAGVDAVISLGPGSAVDAINAKYAMANFGVKTAEDMAKLAEVLGPETHGGIEHHKTS